MEERLSDRYEVQLHNNEGIKPLGTANNSAQLWKLLWNQSVNGVDPAQIVIMQPLEGVSVQFEPGFEISGLPEDGTLDT